MSSTTTVEHWLRACAKADHKELMAHAPVEGSKFDAWLTAKHEARLHASVVHAFVEETDEHDEALFEQVTEHLKHDEGFMGHIRSCLPIGDRLELHACHEEFIREVAAPLIQLRADREEHQRHKSADLTAAGEANDLMGRRLSKLIEDSERANDEDVQFVASIVSETNPTYGQKMLAEYEQRKVTEKQGWPWADEPK